MFTKGVHRPVESYLNGFHCHPVARCDLGVFEFNAGKFNRALKHYMISAKMGYKNSLNAVKDLFMCGHATKEDYKEALVRFRDVTDGMKSPEREEANALEDFLSKSDVVQLSAGR